MMLNHAASCLLPSSCKTVSLLINFSFHYKLSLKLKLVGRKIIFD